MSDLKEKGINFLKLIPVLIFWLLVWELAAYLVDSSIILVSPRVTFMRLFELAGTSEYWRAIGTSLTRIMAGFLIALAAGIILAIASSASKLFYRVLLPAMNVVNAIPIASFVVMALLAIRSERLSVFVAFITVLPIIFHNTYKGISNTDPMLLQMARVFRVKTFKKALHIYVKSVAPFVISAASVGIGFAWKSGIAGELIGIVRGTIGANLHTARIFLQTADVFAWTITIIILSYLMERIFRLIFGRILSSDDNDNPKLWKK